MKKKTTIVLGTVGILLSSLLYYFALKDYIPTEVPILDAILLMTVWAFTVWGFCWIEMLLYKLVRRINSGDEV